MLKLKNIVKTYVSGEEKVDALKGVDIEFRESEFVSILGQSGCGKTTLLNIIGGLDRYTTGDLIINGKSTKDAIEFAVAASALKHSIEGDYNRVSVSEVEKLAGGDGSGRVQR